MNFEGLGVFLSTYLLFFAAFLQVGRVLRQEWSFPVYRDRTSCIGLVLWSWPTQEGP